MREGYLMKMSFRIKALLFIIPVLMLVSAVYTYESIRTQKEIVRDEIIKRSEVFTTLAGKTGELPILSRNEELLKNAASFLRSVSDVSFVFFYDNNMELLVHEGMQVPDPKPQISSDQSITYTEKNNYFDFFAPVYSIKTKDDIDLFQDLSSTSHVREKIGMVRIGFSKAPLKAAEQRMVMRGLMLAALFITGSAIAVSLLIAIATRPLTLLYNAVKKLAKGEYTEVKISSGDEFGELASAFDKMSAAIKERESRLVESDLQIRNLFERVEHAIFRLNSQGDIVRTNRKFDELCGTVDKFCSLFPESTQGLRLQRAVAGELKNVEEKIHDKDGNELAVILSVYPELDEQNNVIGYDGYYVDITEKKKLEESLIQSQKLESLGMLAGGIAHDFNNILTGILGYSSLLKSFTSEDDANYKYLNIIEKSARRAANLTQQLLGFARKGKYNVAKLSVNDIVKELTGFLRETFNRNISIVVETEEKLPPVEGDGNQIYQSIMNLCINARDSMPDGGRLYIKTESYQLYDEKIVDIFQIPSGDYVRVGVTDTGHGMTPEVKKRIFEPFYTTKVTGKGTGLGLAMVYGIIRNHGGYINVYSEPGLGSTISIYLPKAEGVVEEQKKEEVLDEKRKKGTILLIDDEELVRELGKDILEAYNYNVLLAVNGIEGINVFRENRDRVNLVILDMVMPEKSGQLTFRELKGIMPDAKILLCSGYGQEHYFQELFDAGAVGFLQKPFQHIELVKRVEEAVGR